MCAFAPEDTAGRTVLHLASVGDQRPLVDYLLQALLIACRICACNSCVLARRSPIAFGC